MYNMLFESMLRMQGMALDSTELRETTHVMLGHFARLLQADFAPWLPRAVAAALESCTQVPRPVIMSLHAVLPV